LVEVKPGPVGEGIQDDEDVGSLVSKVLIDATLPAGFAL